MPSFPMLPWRVPWERGLPALAGGRDALRPGVRRCWRLALAEQELEAGGGGFHAAVVRMPEVGREQQC